MRIALITYEYPPDTSVGGIATYARQAARLLASRGHDVHVFAGSPRSDDAFNDGGATVHRVRLDDRAIFPDAVVGPFMTEHRRKAFDVIEGPDFMAEAGPSAAAAPETALVVKLHMGMNLIRWTEARGLSAAQRMRLRLRAVRWRTKPMWHPGYPDHAVERRHAVAADEIVAPCRAIKTVAVRLWKIDPARVSVLPNPFGPTPELLAVDGGPEDVVSYVGRLEPRKGVVDFIDAVRPILASRPAAVFNLIGRSLHSPMGGDMRQFLIDRLGGNTAVRFVDPVPNDQIPAILAATTVCVFPSLWENFPNVCLEAMAAGRAIVASSAGGMPDMLADGRAGRLVPPRAPKAIAAAVVELLSDPALRRSLGQAARCRVLSEYGPDQVGPAMEQSYERAIDRAARRGRSAA